MQIASTTATSTSLGLPPQVTSREPENASSPASVQDQTPTLLSATHTSVTALTSISGASSTSQSFMPTILNPSTTRTSSSFKSSPSISPTTVRSRPDLATPSSASQGISSVGTHVDTKSQVGIIVGILSQLPLLKSLFPNTTWL